MKTIRFLPPIFVLIALSACNFTLAADVTPPPGYQQTNPQASVQQTSGPDYPVVPPDPAKGQPIYAEKCAPCHGESGLGNGERAAQLSNPVAPIGSAQLARQSQPAVWFRIVTEGNIERFMPPFASLNDRQRWDVVAYAYSLSAPASNAGRGEEIFQANCADCHGSQGKGDGPKAKELTTQPPNFTSQEYMAERSAAELFQAVSAGVGAEMPAFGSQLSEDDIWALTDHLRWLTFATQTAGSQPQETPAPTTAASLTSPEPITNTGELSPTIPLGTVSGQLVNDSGAALEGGVLEGALVSLHGFDHMQVVMTTTTRTDADGAYRFENIEMPEGRIFLATADYNNVTYGSEIMVVEAGITEVTLPIQVYNSTTDSSQLSVDRLHYFFELLDESTLRVAELYIISNRSGSTLAPAGPGQPSIRFSLPAGAANLNIEDEGADSQRYIMTEDGFGDTTPIRPGESSYQVLYSYELPYTGKLQLDRPLPMPVSAVVILVPEDGILVKGDTIQDAGTRDVQGVPYHMYNGASMPANSSLELTISGKKGSSGSSNPAGSSTSGIMIGLGALGLALIVGGIWLYQRSSRMVGQEETDDPETAVPAAPVQAESAEALMDAILALDDLYQQGQLPQEAYFQRRDELKSRLQQVMGN